MLLFLFRVAQCSFNIRWSMPSVIIIYTYTQINYDIVKIPAAQRLRDTKTKIYGWPRLSHIWISKITIQRYNQFVINNLTYLLSFFQCLNVLRLVWVSKNRLHSCINIELILEILLGITAKSFFQIYYILKATNSTQETTGQYLFSQYRERFLVESF